MGGVCAKRELGKDVRACSLDAKEDGSSRCFRNGKPILYYSLTSLDLSSLMLAMLAHQPLSSSLSNYCCPLRGVSVVFPLCLWVQAKVKEPARAFAQKKHSKPLNTVHSAQHFHIHSIKSKSACVHWTLGGTVNVVVVVVMNLPALFFANDLGLTVLALVRPVGADFSLIASADRGDVVRWGRPEVCVVAIERLFVHRASHAAIRGALGIECVHGEGILLALGTRSRVTSAIVLRSYLPVTTHGRVEFSKPPVQRGDGSGKDSIKHLDVEVDVGIYYCDASPR